MSGLQGWWWCCFARLLYAVVVVVIVWLLWLLVVWRILYDWYVSFCFCWLLLCWLFVFCCCGLLAVACLVAGSEGAVGGGFGRWCNAIAGTCLLLVLSGSSFAGLLGEFGFCCYGWWFALVCCFLFGGYFVIACCSVSVYICGG